MVTFLANILKVTVTEQQIPKCMHLTSPYLWYFIHFYSYKLQIMAIINHSLGIKLKNTESYLSLFFMDVIALNRG